MLIDIYQNLKSRIGFKDTERASIVAKINDAAREIWDSTDLAESLDEIIVDINVDSQLITLPHFCENIRGMRYYDSRVSISLNDSQNRYNRDSGNETWTLRWRIKHRSPLIRDIDNFTRLSFTLAQAESDDFNISISGQSTNSAKSNEVVTIAAGQLTAESVYDYLKVDNIVKSSVTKFDVLITGGDGTNLSVIPNYLKYCKYIVLQIQDAINTNLLQQYSSIEVLYKKQFEPLQNDYDEFAFGNKYDMAIIWKFLEQNKNTVTDAAAAQAKCTQVLDQVRENEEVGIKKKINFAPQPLFQLPYNLYGFRRII
jgi:hypothetical protein